MGNNPVSAEDQKKINEIGDLILNMIEELGNKFDSILKEINGELGDKLDSVDYKLRECRYELRRSHQTLDRMDWSVDRIYDKVRANDERYIASRKRAIERHRPELEVQRVNLVGGAVRGLRYGRPDMYEPERPMQPVDQDFLDDLYREGILLNDGNRSIFGRKRRK